VKKLHFSGEKAPLLKFKKAPLLKKKQLGRVCGEFPLRRYGSLLGFPPTHYFLGEDWVKWEWEAIDKFSPNSRGNSPTLQKSQEWESSPYRNARRGNINTRAIIYLDMN